MSDDTWVFGYGSLIWRPDMSYTDRRVGWIEGWARRFWQESVDHRGVPGAPGRVATLVAEPGARTWGVAFRVGPEVLGPLDVRERGGYHRLDLTVHTRDGGALRAVTYVAGPDNRNWGGPAT